MTAIVGHGDFTYQVAPDWAQLPQGWDFNDVGGVAVDRQDRVYVFNRGGHPMVVFNRDGSFAHAWGEDIFKRPHAVHLTADGTIWCTDEGDHVVRRCTLDGQVLFTLGTAGKPARNSAAIRSTAARRRR